MKYHCFCCDEGEYHRGFSAIRGWFRDRSILCGFRLISYRMGHPRFSRILCLFGKHESYVVSSEDKDRLFKCVRCGCYNDEIRNIWTGEEE